MDFGEVSGWVVAEMGLGGVDGCGIHVHYVHGAGDDQ